jgi:DNA-binding XRE family transcriptional regulator
MQMKTTRDQEQLAELGLGEALRAARLKHGFKQEEIAELLDVATSTISHWERERCTPCLEHWQQLVDLIPELRMCIPPGIRRRKRADTDLARNEPAHIRENGGGVLQEEADSPQVAGSDTHSVFLTTLGVE